MTDATGASRAYLLLGSNDDPERHLPAAVRALGEVCRVIAVSSAYESPAFGQPGEPNYLNAAVVVETNLTPDELLHEVVRPVEQRLGRVRGTDVRPIDVDLVLHGDAILEFGRHRLPDPELLERPYLAIPLASVAHEIVFPGDGRTIGEIAARLDDGSVTLRDDVVLGPFDTE